MPYETHGKGGDESPPNDVDDYDEGERNHWEYIQYKDGDGNTTVISRIKHAAFINIKYVLSALLRANGPQMNNSRKNNSEDVWCNG